MFWPRKKRVAVTTAELSREDLGDPYQQVLVGIAEIQARRAKRQASTRNMLTALLGQQPAEKRVFSVHLPTTTTWQGLWAELRIRGGMRIDPQPPIGLRQLVRAETARRAGEYMVTVHRYPDGTTMKQHQDTMDSELLTPLPFVLFLAFILQHRSFCATRRVFNPTLTWLDAESSGTVAEHGDCTGYFMNNGPASGGAFGQWFFQTQFLHPDAESHVWGSEDWLVSLVLF